VPRIFPAKPDGSAPEIPPIFGTGYVVHEDGIIATNDHVVRAFQRYGKVFSQHLQESGLDAQSWPVSAMLFHRIPEGVAQVPLEILGVATIKSFAPGDVYYGPPRPDLALVHVRARGLPAARVDGDIELSEGTPVATAGFPMGSDALTAPGRLHQLCPTLQQGIVSAVHPFAGCRSHGFALNIMVQGGASGSPVFLPETGAVVGTVYASLGDPQPVWGLGDDGGKHPIGVVRLPTTITHAVPSHYLARILEDTRNDENFAPPEGTQTIADRVAGAELVSMFEKGPFYKPIYGDGRRVEGQASPGAER
jgi:hypothetical protein